MKRAILFELLCIACLIVIGSVSNIREKSQNTYIETSMETSIETKDREDFIKWVDCDVTYEALCYAYQQDIDTYGQAIHLNWIDLIAYAAAKNGGAFPRSAIKDMTELSEKMIQKKITLKKATRKMKYFDYYEEVYHAILDGYVGEYTRKTGGVTEKKYGLKVFLPIAKGFPYNDYDDFGVSRSYGYKRPHLGHDMMGQIGTPIIAVEDGYIEAIGWNQYGGWRIGIRSFDKKRYYYYAHMRQNYPYQSDLKEGSKVKAGEVIGYMGHTGYSAKENVNNIDTVHLHFGIQLIFDESQKDGNGEIWINPYQLCRFLYKNQAEVEKVPDSKEWRATGK